MLNIKWKQRKPVREPDAFSDLLQQVADIRGIDDLQEFLEPSSLSLLSPYLLDNIAEAVERIVKAIKENQHITVFMDFDNDGICSGVMMYRYLKRFTDNVDYLVFNRNSEHGLMRKIIPQTDLLIAVDSSTNDVAECLALKQRGIDVVIIDHHPSTTDNPHAIIVNNQMGTYADLNPTLSGSGVVIKVLEALDDSLGALHHIDFYDLAAVGIIGDVMSLNNLETRYIVAQGLETMRNEGMKQILKKQNADLYNLTATVISFKLVPIINAATRMNQSELVVKLLLCDDPELAAEMAKQCIELNESRKVKQQVAVDNLQFDNSHKFIFCVENELASNMRGLIATSLANDNQKPTIVVKLNEKTGLYEGSGRGYNTVSFKDILEQSGFVDSVAGHDNAFGIQVHKDNVEKLIEYCNTVLEKVEQVLYYDVELESAEVNHEVIERIEKFNRISGKDCEPIKVKVNNLPITERKLMGKTSTSVKLVSDNLLAVKFAVGDNYAEDVGPFDQIDVVGLPQINKWYHRGLKQWVRDLQIIMDDYKKTQEA